MIVKAWNEEYKVNIKKSAYANNDNLAIELIEDNISSMRKDIEMLRRWRG